MTTGYAPISSLTPCTPLLPLPCDTPIPDRSVNRLVTHPLSRPPSLAAISAVLALSQHRHQEQQPSLPHRRRGDMRMMMKMRPRMLRSTLMGSAEPCTTAVAIILDPSQQQSQATQQHGRRSFMQQQLQQQDEVDYLVTRNLSLEPGLGQQQQQRSSLVPPSSRSLRSALRSAQRRPTCLHLLRIWTTLSTLLHFLITSKRTSW